MSRTYTDKELVMATQLAYCNFRKEIVEEAREMANGDCPTLQAIFSVFQRENPGRLYEIFYNYKYSTSPDGDELLMKQDTESWIDDIISGRSEYAQWRLADVHDMNSENGLYAVTLLTEEGEAIVAFRGSESENNYGTDPIQIRFDWLEADLGIASGDITTQEFYAALYLNTVLNDSRYRSITVTGHSLGGDLALVSTVFNCNNENIDKIQRSVSFDGPGHPPAFFEKYNQQIAMVKDKLVHYHWSLVGAIFQSLANEYISIDSDKFESLIWKHSTASLSFSDAGELFRAIDKPYDDLALLVACITNEFITENGDYLKQVVDTFIEYYKADEYYVPNGESLIYLHGEAPYFIVHCGDGNNIVYGGAESDNTIYGDSGDDVIYGGNCNNFIHGGTGDDIIRGGDNQNQLCGDDGDDTIHGGSGYNDIHGGIGNDKLYGGESGNYIYGDEGDDVIHGGTGYNIIFGGTGDDMIYGGENNNVIYGDEGDDTIFCANGYNDVHAGTGDDIVYGGENSNVIYGDEGDDTIHGGMMTDTIHGGLGDDVIKGEGGDDYLYGEEGVNTIYGGNGRDHIYGGSMRDIIYGEDGDDSIEGYGGNDVIYGEIGRDFICGWAGDDYIDGGRGDDELIGSEGNDIIYGGLGDDIISGDDGDDFIDGGGGNDRLRGGHGDNVIYGRSGNDFISSDGFGTTCALGGDGADEIYLGEGKDYIKGEKGNDTLGGAGGDDIYLFNIGDGSDALVEHEKYENTIVFGKGIVLKDIKLSKKDADLVIKYGDNDSINIVDVFGEDGITKRVKHILFNDRSLCWINYEKVRVDAGKKITIMQYLDYYAMPLNPMPLEPMPNIDARDLHDEIISSEDNAIDAIYTFEDNSIEESYNLQYETEVPDLGPFIIDVINEDGVYECDAENVTEKYSGTNNSALNNSEEDQLDYMVEQSLYDTYNTDYGVTEDYFCNDCDNVDNMTSLIVQDMSEAVCGNISDSAQNTVIMPTEETTLLWIED